MAEAILAAKRQELALLRRIEERILWLASWTIHNANHLRESRDGLKVGGHQASCASMTTLMTALYMKALRPQDRVAVKPHASPVFHAIQHLFGRQSLDKLKAFRALGGAQSYPSRTKDADDVDFSTGSVGLGVAMTAFASLTQDYLAARGAVKPERMGRMISLLGDAELDEGNIYEALIEACKHDIRNTWWIVDYNRQSLDATTQDRMFTRYGEIFEAAGWTVETLKWSKRQREAFAKPGGEALKAWIETAPNDLYAALSYQGGAAWRERLSADLAGDADALALVAGYKDLDLGELMTELGGHCMETILEAFERAGQDDAPRFFIAYTVKGLRLPFQGHKDNHAGLMTETQIAELRGRLGVTEGEEWDALSGLSSAERTALKGLVARAPFAADVQRRHLAPTVATPTADELLVPVLGGGEQSTQAAFGKVMFEISRRDDEFAGRVVTTSPDVTVSTNLGGFVNRRGVFQRRAHEDVFKRRRIPSSQVWSKVETGQHVELGIAENNLFIVLAALGLTAPLFGERLFPVGTLYDPFIARGLDALNYACYQDARFLLVATPSGLTLAPEGGAHQSIGSPLIGMSQPGLDAYEPAFADETAVLMAHAFERIQAEQGASTYLRLSTRVIAQPERADDAWRRGVVEGAYWLRPPAPGARLAIAYAGALAPEALAAFEAVLEDEPGAGLLAITSADVLHQDWTAAGRSRWTDGAARTSTIETLLAPLSRDAGLVTVIDGAPSTLSWLGSVRGMRLRALGLETFGQSGDLPDLYAKYRLDADAILDACADLLI
ncbi:pyruvate dehydrogenase complex, dehydrogenase (E1) component [Caulobacter sp. AP07]|uniref:transketolase n=1 Tax=Caulobacter sp. AP07 TaxID=1144304 RepID=UPI00027211BB|nr:transketolase [Caulobacter sp. AP07]EJL25285.1 pyruvate dehydrogenase complex, dehydrogenase (E1) component [Caulobacter sp. AP07]